MMLRDENLNKEREKSMTEKERRRTTRPKTRTEEGEEGKNVTEIGNKKAQRGIKR